MSKTQVRRQAPVPPRHSEAPQRPRWAPRVVAFSTLALICGTVGVAYLVHVNDRTADQERSARKVAVAPPGQLATYAAEPHVVMRSTALGDTYGKVALVPLSQRSAPRALAGLSCERVDYAAGSGVCLQADRGVLTTYHAVIFDRRFRVRRSFDLAGVPSRVRVSPDGKWAGVTVFVTGHSYADTHFSTQTNIVNLETGEVLPSLEEFTVRDGDSVVDAIDRNYWGVTFIPGSDQFYATLQTGDRIHLIKGDASARTGEVVGDDVECPSLSPDGNEDRVQGARCGNGHGGELASRCAGSRVGTAVAVVGNAIG